MEILTFLYSFTLGYLGYDTTQFIANEARYQDMVTNAYEITLSPELVLYDFVFVGGSYTSQFVKGEQMFKPIMDTFEFSAGLRHKIDGVTVELGYYHKCVHPVLSIDDGSRSLYGGKDKVYLEVSNKWEHR